MVLPLTRCSAPCTVSLVLCTGERCRADADPCCCCSEQKDDPDEEKLAREMKEFGDIVRIDMVDTYADLSMKTMRMFSALPQKVRSAAFNLRGVRVWRMDALGGLQSLLAVMPRKLLWGCYGAVLSTVPGGCSVGLPSTLGSLAAAALCRHAWWLSSSTHSCSAAQQKRWGEEGGGGIVTVSALHRKQETLVSCPLLCLCWTRGGW